MTNKTTKICCTLALLASVAATPAFSQAKNFAGPSLAINGSLNGSSSNIKTTDNYDSYSYFEAAKFGDVNTVFGADLNYGFIITNNFVLGVGATYDFGKTKAGEDISGEDDIETDGIKASIKDRKSVYVQPTYLLSSSTGLFAKIGYNEAKYNLEGSDYYLGDIGTLTEKLKGWGYGFGIKTFINDNLFIQAEVQQINYGRENLYNEDLIGDGDAIVGNYSVDVKPKINSGTISIGYKF
jgi:opacity protein-like surface antigen